MLDQMAERHLPLLPAPLRSARVLLVDDQELNLRTLRHVLEKAGLEQVVATQDPHAVEGLVAVHHPDLMIIDLHMPGLDGLGVMRALRPQLDAAGYLPILVLTADPSDQARRQALEGGAKDFVTKPIDSMEVILRTRNLLETRMLYLQLEDRNAHLEERVRERTAEVEAAQFETLDRLARTAEYRDDQTGRHVVRVGRASARIARVLGLDEATIRLLRVAAPLHDLGKIAIPDRILLAPRKLTPDEFEEMQAHTTIGSRILAGSSSPLLQLAERIAMTHHEKWDGSGYHGLAKGAIPLASRIVGLCDVFDALTHERPYKSAWPVDMAVEEIDRARGAHFDPAVVDAFHELDPVALVNPAESVPGTVDLGDRWTEIRRARAVAG